MAENERWALYGAPDSEVIVAGHSHAKALMRGAQHPPEAAQRRRAVAYSSPVTAGAPTGDDYWRFVAGHRSAEAIAVVWNGNQHNVDFLFEQSPPLHVLRAGLGGGEAPRDAVWVPRSMMRAHFRPTVDELAAVLERLRGSARVVVLGTPAPKPSVHVRGAVAGDAHFASILAASPADRQPEVAREELRLALWEITQEMLRECAADAGVEYLPSPAVSIDASGLLLPAFSAPDSTHANLDYGDLVWNDLERYLDRSAAA